MADLAWATWSADELNTAANAALVVKRIRLQVVKKIPAERRTFENTPSAFAHAGDELSSVHQIAQLLLSVHPEQAMRDAAQKVYDRLTAEDITLSYDPELFRAMKEWESAGDAPDEAGRKLAHDIMRDMRRTGLGLPPAQLAQVTALQRELQQLEAEFEKVINEYEDHISVTPDELAGLPETYRAQLRRGADGTFLVGLSYPEYFPFMRLAESDDARRRLAHANLRKGGSENLERFARLVRLRRQIAMLLGYATHADLQIEPRTAKNSANAKTFLNDIITKLTPVSRGEFSQLVAEKQRVRGGKPSSIGYHEFSYWSHRLLKERHNVDSEQVRQYFPLAHVMQQMLDIYQELFGLRFTVQTGVPTWHPEVSVYEVYDTGTGDALGCFLFDMHPRVGKYQHAATFPAVLGHRTADGAMTLGALALVCNLPKPTLTEPSLLTHEEVGTVFHEFGHVVHALVSGGRWQQQNGFGTPQDFIEAPSQIFEEWPWHPAVLRRISSHWQTGKPLPDALRESMIAARYHMEAHEYLTQAVNALYDLTAHTIDDEGLISPKKLAALYRTMRLRLTATELPDDSLFPAGWGHMADYDAGYYSYLWSKVYALDMYTRFVANPLDAAVGARYRLQVLAPGDSRPPLESVREFLGRESSDGAFIKALGLSTKESV